ncbi:hypothetical protein BC832DRAFT_622603 [Gaertneriomyces semiglobifer]|nr:hypothetical protein BC832DRAFT_622603 [Gaertneriomyces semiglobifer]
MMAVAATGSDIMARFPPNTHGPVDKNAMVMLLSGHETVALRSGRRAASGLMLDEEGSAVGVLLLMNQEQAEWLQHWAVAGGAVKMFLDEDDEEPATSPTSHDALFEVSGRSREFLPKDIGFPGLMIKVLNPRAKFGIVFPGTPEKEEFLEVVEPWLIASWAEGYTSRTFGTWMAYQSMPDSRFFPCSPEIATVPHPEPETEEEVKSEQSDSDAEPVPLLSALLTLKKKQRTKWDKDCERHIDHMINEEIAYTMSMWQKAMYQDGDDDETSWS